MADLLTLPVPATEASENSARRARRDLLKRLDALEDEGKAARQRYRPSATIEDALRLYRDEQGPAGGQAPYFKANFIEAFLDRQVAQMTDNRPAITVEPRKVGLAALARVLDACADAVWGESKMQRQTWKLALMAGVMGSAGAYTGYDPVTDDIYVEVISQRDLWLDPTVREAALINPHAEYLGIERIRPLADLALRFPGVGGTVEADVTILETESEARAGRLLSPLDTMVRRLRSGPRDLPSTEGLPRARTTELFLRDRAMSATGARLFPTYRKIIRTADVILSDEPLPFWDGEIPVDLYDWQVDPEHPWGSSEPEGLRHMQGAYNQLLDGTVENHILTSFIQVLGDADAMDEKTWAMFAKIKKSIIVRKKNRNASVAIVPPTPFGADTIALARFIFTQMQLKTGVTDVTLGEHPGSLQSGAAIEGLQEGASLMTRSRQSRLEDFYTRVGQKLVARILQFMTSDRIIGLVGPTSDAIQAALHRNELFVSDDGHVLTEAERREVFRYLRFAVVPGSSRTGAKQQRAKMLLELHKTRLASRLDVLRAAEIGDPEAMLARADEEWPKLFPPPPPKK